MGKRIDLKKTLLYIVLFTGCLIVGIILTELPNSNIATETVAQESSVEYIPSGSEMENGKININSATSQTLQQLDGIGEKLSQRIIDYRTNNGEFKSIENIMDVPGMGNEKFEKIKEYICAGS